MAVLELKNDTWKLLIAPEVGASIAGLYGKVQGNWQAIMREIPKNALESKNPSKFSSFTLAPFSNRIKRANFEFLGKSYQLRSSSADGNTQHGDVRSRPWQILKTSDSELVLGLNTQDFSDFNFPFPFFLTVQYFLEGTLFGTSLSLKNTGESSMPAGFGIHPYFNQALLGKQAELRFKADALYEVDSETIPTGNVAKPKAKARFEQARAVDIPLNHLYRDWSELSLNWSGLAKLDIFAEPIFKHLIVFTHADGSLALEPVSNATDGFNLMNRGFEGHGVQILRPSESMQGSIHMSLNS
jgi:aldose 1-epimerase